MIFFTLYFFFTVLRRILLQAMWPFLSTFQCLLQWISSKKHYIFPSKFPSKSVTLHKVECYFLLNCCLASCWRRTLQAMGRFFQPFQWIWQLLDWENFSPQNGHLNFGSKCVSRCLERPLGYTNPLLQCSHWNGLVCINMCRSLLYFWVNILGQ